MDKAPIYQTEVDNGHFFKRRWQALGHALRGIGFCIKRETHFQLQVLVSVITIVVGVVVGLSRMEWLLVVVCIMLMLTLEAVNTAMEHLCNVVQPGYHPGIKRVKDVAAGAVLIAAVGSCVVGCFIFLPKLSALFQ